MVLTLHTMFRPSVNVACNNALFTLRTMDLMKKPGPIHASISRLYAVAADIGDNAPAKVARRLNVSAQTLNNWETRGISQAGAVAVQGVYGCSAAWIVTGNGDRRTPPESLADHSQVVRLDADMLAETHAACRRWAERQGKTYSMETHPARFLQVYLVRVKLSPRLSDDELMELGAAVQEIMTAPQGALNGRTDGVPTTGTNGENVARGGGGSKKA